MKAISAEDMRLLDSRTIQEGGISGEKLMKTAGVSLASAIMEYIAELESLGVCESIEVQRTVSDAVLSKDSVESFLLERALNNVICETI